MSEKGLAFNPEDNKVIVHILILFFPSVLASNYHRQK